MNGWRKTCATGDAIVRHAIDELRDDLSSLLPFCGNRNERRIGYAEGRIARYAIKDPSFNNWTGLAIAARGQLVADFPLCNKSFGLSYSGNDL